MRKILATMFSSLDDVVEAPHEWHFPYFNDEMGAAVDRVIGSSTDTLLLGRETYEGFADAWPSRETDGDEFAKHLGDCRKIVVSNQDIELPWRNSELLKGGLEDGVRALKEESGTHIAISGSPSVVRQLLAAGLLDELHLLVHPIALGKGTRLFEGLDAPVPLKLISSATFKTGVLDLVYGPAD